MSNPNENQLDLNQLVNQLLPHIAQRLVNFPAFYGDPRRVTIGKNVGVTNTLFNTTSGNIIVGDYTFFGHNVCLLTGTHDIQKKWQERIDTYPRQGNDIIIEKGVWLASNVTVLGPCKIGECAVIAAGSLVLNDIPPNCLYAGSPAKFIKEIEYPDPNTENKE